MGVVRVNWLSFMPAGCKEKEITIFSAAAKQMAKGQKWFLTAAAPGRKVIYIEKQAVIYEVCP
ncbi:MAG: hypothetical protein ABFR97_04025 [Thermodesulfobacteriota bacterium]